MPTTCSSSTKLQAVLDIDITDISLISNTYFAKNSYVKFQSYKIYISETFAQGSYAKIFRRIKENKSKPLFL